MPMRWPRPPLRWPIRARPDRPKVKIAYIGIGVMGGPMAGHLVAAGHDLRVYNRSRNKAEAWCARHAGHVFDSPAQAAQGADVVISCVGNDDDLREVCLTPGSGAYASLAQGALHIDHTTSSAQVARDLDQAARAQGLAFVDAPVSGGQAGAENGVLSIMCGGQEQDYQRAAQVFSAYAGSHALIGPVGSGQLTKMVNQICVAGVIQGLAEGLRLGELAGLDMTKVLAVIENGAAGSWQMANRGASMLEREFDFGFAIDWMRKDLGIVENEADKLGAPLRMTRQIHNLYDELSRSGRGRQDTSALIAALDDPKI